MTKSHRSRKGVLKALSKTSKKALPMVNKGLKNVGAVAKTVAIKSAPVIEKGVSVVYETMATGFDLGIKGVKNISAKSGRSKSGGKRTKRRHSRRTHRRR